MRFSYCLFVYLQPEPGSRGGVAVYDSRVGAVIRRCIKPSHVIHLALHKQVFLYIEPSSLHITIDLVSIKYFNTLKGAGSKICTEAERACLFSALSLDERKDRHQEHEIQM